MQINYHLFAQTLKNLTLLIEMHKPRSVSKQKKNEWSLMET